MIVFFLFVVVILIRLCYHLYFFRALSAWKAIDTKEETKEGVSIVVCNKNNANGLKKLVPALLNQVYDNFEVILVDDFSSDESWQFMRSIANSKVIAIQAFTDKPGKKVALSQGIAQAKHDWILVTDADCLPDGNQWVQTMMKYTNKYDVVLGYGPNQKALDFVHHFARFETTMTALQYLTFALKDLPYMGVGRNLLYRKSLYHEVGGFASHNHLSSGDDDLFIQSIIGRADIGICVEQSTFMYSQSKGTWKEFIQQKIRHVSTATSYSSASKFLLALLSFSHVSSWILLICCLIVGGKIGLYASIAFLVYCLLTVVNVYKPFRMLGSSDLLSKFVFMDFAFFVYYIIMSPFIIYHKRQVWN